MDHLLLGRWVARPAGGWLVTVGLRVSQIFQIRRSFLAALDPGENGRRTVNTTPPLQEVFFSASRVVFFPCAIGQGCSLDGILICLLLFVNDQHSRLPSSWTVLCDGYTTMIHWHGWDAQTHLAKMGP